MGWLRAIALSGREPFPTPVRYVEWELYPPHAQFPNPPLPTNVALNPNSNLPPEPTGPQAFVQTNQNNQVPIPVPPPTPPFGGP